MGGAMFYPRTSVLPTIKTSLPSSINCLTDHRLDDGHQSRFHEHNHCWLHRLCRQKREEIYLFDEKPPLLLRSGGYCPTGGLRTIVHAAQFPIFWRRISAFSATAQHEKICHQPEESVEKFCFVGRCRKNKPANARQPSKCGVAAPLLLLSRPPYIAAGKQMSGHKYAGHKLQGKKAGGGADCAAYCCAHFLRARTWNTCAGETPK